MANGKGRQADGDKAAVKKMRKRDRMRTDPASVPSIMPEVLGVAAVALALGAGLGILLFGASRRMAGAAADGVPGNLALGGDATGGLTSLADDGGIGMASAIEDESGAPSDDWYAMREGAGGAGPAATASGGEGAGEHVPTDLAPGTPHPDRAIEAFRPDRDAAVLPAERDAFAPATMPVPSRVEAMGNGDDD